MTADIEVGDHEVRAGDSGTLGSGGLDDRAASRLLIESPDQLLRHPTALRVGIVQRDNQFALEILAAKEVGTDLADQFQVLCPHHRKLAHVEASRSEA